MLFIPSIGGISHDFAEDSRDDDIELIGDMPIFIASDSADVWSQPELFQLDAIEAVVAEDHDDGRDLQRRGYP